MIKNKLQKNTPEIQTIEKSFELSIVDDNLKNLTIDIAGLSIDSLLDDGILKDLPVVGGFAKLCSIGVNIHDKLFLKKILSFLNQLKDIPQDKRIRMMEKINNDKKYRIKVGEKLLYILDSCNDYENSKRIGIAFDFFMRGKITRLEFEKAANIISQLDNITLHKFLDKCGQVSLREDIENFMHVGLVYIDYKNMTIDQTRGLSITESGKLIMKIFKNYDKK